MADTKISALPSSTTPLAGTEVLPIVQSSTTKQVSVANLTAGRTVSGSNFISGSDSATYNVVAGASTTGPGVQMFGKSAGAAPGWMVYSSGTADFVGVHAWYKNNFAGTATYLGGWYSNGDYKIDAGNLVQGTAAKGINFTANTPASGMTSQLLNWYEEGTWTPGIAGQASGSATLSVAYGTYTRIGRQVTVKGRIAFSASTLSGGQIFISGLPWASNNTANNYSVGTMLAENITYTGQIYWFLNPNESGAYFLTGATGAAAGTLAGGAFGSTSAAIFSLTYFI